MKQDNRTDGRQTRAIPKWQSLAGFFGMSTADPEDDMRRMGEDDGDIQRPGKPRTGSGRHDQIGARGREARTRLPSLTKGRSEEHAGDVHRGIPAEMREVNSAPLQTRAMTMYSPSRIARVHTPHPKTLRARARSERCSQQVHHALQEHLGLEQQVPHDPPPLTPRL